MSRQIYEKSATELAREIRNEAISPVEVVDAFLDRINERNGEINAFITLMEEEAREAAIDAEAAVNAGEDLGPLHGVPVAVKDQQATKKGVRHTFGSKLFEDFVPEEDSIIVKRLEKAGAIIVGKTNTPEFAHKPHTDNKVVGATGNPFDPRKSAGGSSGGSAAAVADKMVPIAQGSDGGGSIRVPSSLCGVYGLKPTPGRNPFEARPDGFIHYYPYLHVGPITRTVEDAALMLDVLSGPHPRDPRSLPTDDTNYVTATSRSIDELQIAYSPDLNRFPISPEVNAVMNNAIKRIESGGVNVEEVDFGIGCSVEELRETWAKGWEPIFAERAEILKRDPHNLDVLGEDRDEVEPEVVEKMERGYEYSAVETRVSNITRTEFFDSLQNLFQDYDLLLLPTTATTAFDKNLRVGPDEVDGEEVNPWGGWYLTWPFNLTPTPVASIPAGTTKDGLPVGMQIAGKRFADETVIAASAEFERLIPWDHTYDM